MKPAMAALAPPAKKTKPAKRPPIQAKLTVGASDDRLERESDRVAARIGSAKPRPAASPPPTISRVTAQRVALSVTSGPEEKDERLRKPQTRVQRKTDAGTTETVRSPIGAEGGEAPAVVEAEIQHLRTRAAPRLDPDVRDKVEAAVGADLGDVRVHHDRAAAQAASSLGARAFTIGQDMFFGEGEFHPGTTEGQRLIAHEATHTVQQRGGSGAVPKIQRAKKAKAKKPKITSEETRLEGPGWSLDSQNVPGAKGELTVPELQLPMVLGALKGAANEKLGLELKAGLPEENQPFTVNPKKKREERNLEDAYEVWLADIKKHRNKDRLRKVLTDQLTRQKKAGVLKNRADADVYVLKRSAGDRKEENLLLVGTLESLTTHDSILRPMISPKKGGLVQMQADHILEDQLGGPNTAANMWLLAAKTNQSLGSGIKNRVDQQIKTTLTKVQEKNAEKRAKGVGFEGTIPSDVQAVKRLYVLTFTKVVATKDKTATVDNYWTRDEILRGDQIKWYKALTEEELTKEGFEFDPDRRPTRINLFPSPDGGKLIPFPVNKKGNGLDLPPFFYKGLYVDRVDYNPGWTNDPTGKIAKLLVRYQKKDEKRRLVEAGPKWVVVQHDKRLGFGGYLSRGSIVDLFGPPTTFKPLSPVTFTDVSITGDGELVATGSATSTLALFPNLHVPLMLRGDEVVLDFPVPGDGMSLGPVSLVDPAISMGVGPHGFFLAGSTGVAIDGLGHGVLLAKATQNDVVIAGEFDFDLDFLDPAHVAVSYSLEQDDFSAKATLGVQKGALPGVKAGQVTVTATRESFAVSGGLDLAGPLEGSQIAVDYNRETGLTIVGKDLPLPLEKLPGVSDAKVTVIVRRRADTGEWEVSGGGKAAFDKGGAKGSLDILFDGEAVDLTGRVDLVKEPAVGWIQISASNRAVDDEGKPIPGAPVASFAFWGMGEATVLFGKYLKGTVGIEYTREGRVILAGQVAMAQAFDLFPKKDLSPKKPLFDKETPDFPIWGVKLGPVGVGIFAYGYARIWSVAYVGPGQLKDAVLGVDDLDLEKPELATVTGGAKFTVPAYAGLSITVGGGLKAQVANAYAKGELGLYGDLGVLLQGSFEVTVAWTHADGFAVGADPRIEASPKFEFGVEGRLKVGVDLWVTDLSKTWGPWKKPLGKFGPDMPFVMDFPIRWSEKDGLDLDVEDLKPPEPNIAAKEILKGAFDTLV
jgi:hypothetical protein